MPATATVPIASDRQAALGRSWRRFSLRSLLVATTLFAVVLGTFMVRLRTQQEAVAVIENLGGSVTYESNWLARVLPASIQRPISQHALADVVAVHLKYRTIDRRMTRLTAEELTAAVDAISRLPHVTQLRLYHLRLTDADIARLAPLNDQIEELTIQDLVPGGWRGTNLEPLAGFRELQSLSVLLWNPDRAIDSEPLIGLPKLTSLTIGQGYLHEEVFRDISQMESLDRLVLSACTFDGEHLRHLQRLPHLKSLGLRNIHAKVEYTSHRVDEQGNLQPHAEPSIRFLPTGDLPMPLLNAPLRDHYQKWLKKVLPNVNVAQYYMS